MSVLVMHLDILEFEVYKIFTIKNTLGTINMFSSTCKILLYY